MSDFVTFGDKRPLHRPSAGTAGLFSRFALTNTYPSVRNAANGTDHQQWIGSLAMAAATATAMAAWTRRLLSFSADSWGWLKTPVSYELATIDRAKTRKIRTHCISWVFPPIVAV